MDVAGSAVGIISLGIQLCNGIISYYNAYSGQNSELDNTLRNLQTLRELLTSLDTPQTRLSSAHGLTAPTAKVEECIAQCNKSMLELQVYLDKCREVRPDVHESKRSLSDAFKIHVKKALFPFRRDSLDSLKHSVDRVKNNLDTAIDILHLNVSYSAHEQLSSLTSTAVIEGVRQVEIQESLARVETHVESTSSAIPEITAEVARSASILETNLPSIEGNISSISHEIPRLEAQILLIPQKVDELLTSRQLRLEQKYHASFQGLEEEFNRFTQSAMGNPSLTRNLLDNSIESQKTAELSSSPLTLSCSCRPTIDRGRKTKFYGPFIIFKGYSNTRLHTKDCIYSGIPHKQNVFGLQLQFSNSLLRGILGTSMSMVRGAGGYSIAPSIHFRPVVPHDSPGFALIEKISSYYTFLNPDESNSEEFGAHIDDTLLWLRKAFADKLASVFDTDSLGNNLLHAACSVFGSGPAVAGQVNMDKHGNLLAPSYRRFLIELCTLMDNCGAGFNEPNVFGYYPLDIMLDSTLVQQNFNSNYASISVELNNIGATVSSMCHYNLGVYSKRSSAAGPQHIRPDMNIARYLASVKIPEDMVEVFRCGELCQAVLQRNANRVKELLAKYPARSNLERTVLGQSPLHLAVGWPPGVEILLAAFPHMIEIPDDRGAIPLTYACYFQCEDSVSILLNSDSPFDSGLLSGDSHVLYATIQMPSTSIKKLVITALAGRRQRLRDLALEKLGRKRLRLLASDHLLDANAERVYGELVNYGIPVPNALSPFTGSGTVYHRIFLEGCPGAAEVADIFFQAGFEDIDSLDINGLTPLMNGPGRYSFMTFRDYLQYTTWLVLHGADWDRKPDIGDNDMFPEIVAVDYVAHRLGQALRQSFSNDSAVLDAFSPGVNPQHPNYSLLGSICVQTHSHICRCACSFSDFACIPAVILLRSMGLRDAAGDDTDSEDSKFEHAEESRKFLRSFTVNWLSECLELKGENRLVVAVCVLRLLTFEEMELPHTCCILDEGDIFQEKATFSRRDDEEVEEIQDEYKISIAQLEQLMDEFVPKYAKSNVELSEFLKGHWAERMEEILKPRPYEADELKRIEELGVVLEGLAMDDGQPAQENGVDESDWETEEE